MQVKRVPAALIGILLASVGVGRAQDAQEVENTEQPADQLVFTMMRDLSGVVQATRRSRFEEAVETANRKACYDPAALEWRALTGFTAEQAAVFRRHTSHLLRIKDIDTGRSRYGLRLPSSRLGLVQRGDEPRVTGRVMNGVTVIDGATAQPVPGARVLLLADQGRVEPVVCLLDTNSDGQAVLPLARRVFATVVAAEGFVGGVVAPDRSATVRLTPSRTIGGRVEGVTPAAGYDLVAAVPRKTPDTEDEDLMAAAWLGPDGEFTLQGVPASTSSLLLAVFRANYLMATTRHGLSDSPVVIRAGRASVAFASADPDATIELRFLRLPDGSEVRDHALGRMARPFLGKKGSSYSRPLLPTGLYDIRSDGETLAEFFLEPDEDLDLGVLGAVEEFTLEIRGLAGRTGEVWWSRELCFHEELGHENTRITVGPQQLLTLWIPEGCRRIWGQVSAPGMVAGHFDWNRGDPLEAVVTLRPGFTITGSAWAPEARPLVNARVDAFNEFELQNSRDGRYPRPAATRVVDAQGRFDLTVDHRTSYFVKVIHPGYFAPAHRVDLAAGPAPDLVIEARRGAAVAGVVRSPSGRPVEGATVHWCYLGREPVVLPNTYARIEGCKKQRPASGDRAEVALWHLEGGQTIQTDAAGAFRTEGADALGAGLFTALPPGETEFTVRPWGGHAETSIHTLEPGDNEIEITVRRGIRIEGQVLDLPEGSLAAEVHLATGTEPDVWTRWATKTAETVRGAFLFENLEAGPRPYHLYATAPGYQSLESQVVLQVGDGARAVALKLVPNSSVIEGSIDLFELGSTPRLTAISRTAEERIAAIDAGGAFAFTDLPVGEWRLVLSHGVPSRHEQITLRLGIALAHEGDRERLDIDLGSLPTLHFVGREPGVLRIHGLGEHDSAFGPVATVPVDETGQATIHAPAPGNYWVSYQTRPGPDGTTQSYALDNQRLEGTQTFHLEDFDSNYY